MALGQVAPPDLAKPIKDLGEHEIVIKLVSEVHAKLTITVNHPAPKDSPATAEASDAKGGKKPKAKKA